MLHQVKLYRKYQEYLKCVEVEKERRDYAIHYIDYKLASISSILEKYEFHQSPKKEIAQMIHEVHPLVVTDLLLHTDFFKDYSTVDLFSLLSCFCEVKVEDSCKLLNPKRLKDECGFIKKRLDVYVQEEYFADLSSSGQEILQYDMMEFIQAWMSCQDEETSLAMLQDVKWQKSIFVGDFIKCCLKLVNVAKELDRIERLDFREKLREGSQLLTKFICTHDSLYL